MLIVNLMDRADIRMVQRGSGQCLRIFGNLIRQELQGNKAVQLHVFRLVDHTHPATAEFLDMR
jgi:hypothetical protein